MSEENVLPFHSTLTSEFQSNAVNTALNFSPLLIKLPTSQRFTLFTSQSFAFSPTYLHLDDERALPGNLQSRTFFNPPS
jgi:hypothetical protein